MTVAETPKRKGVFQKFCCSLTVLKSLIIIQTLLYSVGAWAFSRNDGQLCQLIAFPVPEVMDVPGCSIVHAADGYMENKAYCVTVGADD
jgi:hypothetical protein